MEDLDIVLQEYVATANNPDYGGDWSVINSKFPELANINRTGAAMNQYEMDLASGKFTPQQMAKKIANVFKMSGFGTGEMLNKTGWGLLIIEDWKVNNPNKKWWKDTVKYTDDAGKTVLKQLK